MPARHNPPNQNITIPVVLLILAIISMTVGGVLGVASLKSSLEVLTSSVNGLKTQIEKIDERQRLNDTRLTKLETMAGNRTGATQ